MKILKYIIAISWAIFIYAIFYASHAYYGIAFFTAIWKFGFLIVSLGLIFLGLRFIYKKYKAIHLRSIFITMLFLPILLTSYDFFSNNLSVVTGGAIVKQDSGVSFSPSGESLEGKTIIFEEDLPVRQTDRILKQLPENLHQYFQKVSFLKSMAFLTKNITLNLFTALLFFILFSSLGLSVFFRKSKIEAKDRALSFFLGAGIFSVTIFFLGVFGVFTTKTFLLLSACSALISHRAILDNCKFLFSTKLNLKEFDAKNLVMMSGLILMFSMLSVDFIRVMPIAWDDSNLYMRGAKLFAQNNFFIEGVGPSAWTLLQSIGWLFSNTPLITFSLLFATLTTGIFLFYSIAEKFLDERKSLIATIFLMSIPMLTFLSIIDTKTEIPLLFSGAATILAWLEWREKKEKKYLLIASILMGLTVTIKVTSIIFLITILLATIYVETGFIFLTTALFFLALAIFAQQNFMQTLNVFQINSQIAGYIFAVIGGSLLAMSTYKEKFWQSIHKFKPALQILLIVIIIFAPWSILQVYSIGTLNFSNMIFGGKHIPTFLSSDLVEACSFVDLSVQADYKRYTGLGNGLKALLLFPFYSTMTFDLKTFISDITPIFLSIIPFLLLFPKKIFAENKKIICLALFTFAYVILWALTSSGVMWYGIFMLIPGVILLFFIQGKNKYLSIFIAITLFANILVRVNHFAEVFNLSYAFGIQRVDKIIEGYYPGFQDVSKIMDTYPEAKLYRIGSQIKFFLPIPDSSILDDDYLGSFACLAQGNTIEGIKKAFANAGITHAFITTNSDLGDVTYGAIYKEQLERIKLFFENSGWKLLYDDHGIKLYEIK